MTSVMVGPGGERVIRWMDEGQAVFENVRRLLHECSQFKEAAEAARQECEQLRRSCEELREEVRLLKAEAERLRTAQKDTAQWLAAMMKDAAARFRIETPPA